MICYFRLATQNGGKLTTARSRSEMQNGLEMAVKKYTVVDKPLRQLQAGRKIGLESS